LPVCVTFVAAQLGRLEYDAKQAGKHGQMGRNQSAARGAGHKLHANWLTHTGESTSIFSPDGVSTAPDQVGDFSEGGTSGGAAGLNAMN
jgi:hypothetical protein